MLEYCQIQRGFFPQIITFIQTFFLLLDLVRINVLISAIGNDLLNNKTKIVIAIK